MTYETLFLMVKIKSYKKVLRFEGSCIILIVHNLNNRTTLCQLKALICQLNLWSVAYSIAE